MVPLESSVWAAAGAGALRLHDRGLGGTERKGPERTKAMGGRSDFAAGGGVGFAAARFAYTAVRGRVELLSLRWPRNLPI